MVDKTPYPNPTEPQLPLRGDSEADTGPPPYFKDFNKENDLPNTKESAVAVAGLAEAREALRQARSNSK